MRDFGDENDWTMDDRISVSLGWTCLFCSRVNAGGDRCLHCFCSRDSKFVTGCPVNHPPHYTTGSVECIDAIKEALGDGFKDFLSGNILKYLWRAEHKGNAKQDYEKARWYLTRLIEETE